MGVLERLQEAQGRSDSLASESPSESPDLRATLAAQEERTATRGKAFREKERSKTTVYSRLEAARAPSAQERGQEAVSRFVGGLAEIPAGVVDSVGIALEAADAMKVPLSPALMATGKGKDVGAGAKRFAEGIRDLAKWAVPGAEKAADSFLYGQVPEALGSGAGFLLGGGILKGLGVPAALSTMGMGASVGASAQYHDARLSGANEQDQWKAYLLGAGVGLTEAVPLSRMLNRIDKGAGGGLRRVLVDAAIEGTEEAAQEAFQTEASNLIASHLVGYDPDRELLEGVIEGGGAGFLSGIFLSGLASSAAQRRARTQAPPEPETDALPEEGKPEVAPTTEEGPDFAVTVDAAKPGEDVELEKRLQAGYKGPESIRAKERPAGFTDSQAEAQRAMEIGLDVFVVNDQARGKTWYLYHGPEGEIQANKLGAHLQEHGYGDTTEKKLELSRLAGYTEEQIADFRSLLEGKEAPPAAPPEEEAPPPTPPEVQPTEAPPEPTAPEEEEKKAKAAQKKEFKRQEAEIKAEAEKEHRPATTAHRGELARQAELLGVPEEELERARKTLDSANNADFALEQILEEWTAPEAEEAAPEAEEKPEPEKIRLTEEAFLAAVQLAKKQGAEQGREEQQRLERLKEHVERTGDLPKAQRQTRLGKEYAAFLAKGAPRGLETLEKAQGKVNAEADIRQREAETKKAVEKAKKEPAPKPAPKKAEPTREELVARGQEIDGEMARLERLRRTAKLEKTKERHKKKQEELHAERQEIRKALTTAASTATPETLERERKRVKAEREGLEARVRGGGPPQAGMTAAQGREEAARLEKEEKHLEKLAGEGEAKPEDTVVALQVELARIKGTPAPALRKEYGAGFKSKVELVARKKQQIERLLSMERGPKIQVSERKDGKSLVEARIPEPTGGYSLETIGVVEKGKSAQALFDRWLEAYNRIGDATSATIELEEGYQRLTKKADAGQLGDSQRRRGELEKKLGIVRSKLKDAEKGLRRTKAYGKPTARRQELLSQVQVATAAIKSTELELEDERTRVYKAELARAEEAVLAERDPQRQNALISMLPEPGNAESKLYKDVVKRKDAAWERFGASVEHLVGLVTDLAEKGTGSRQWYVGHLRNWYAGRPDPALGLVGKTLEKFFPQLSQHDQQSRRRETAHTAIRKLENHRNVDYRGLHEQREAASRIKTEADLKKVMKRVGELGTSAQRKTAEQEREAKKTEFEQAIGPALTLESFAEGLPKTAKGNPTYPFKSAYEGNMANEAGRWYTTGKFLVLKEHVRKAARKAWGERSRGRFGTDGVAEKSMDSIFEPARKNDRKATLIGHVQPLWYDQYHDKTSDQDPQAVFSIGKEKELGVLNANYLNVLIKDVGVDGFRWGEGDGPVALYVGETMVGVIMPVTTSKDADTAWSSHAQKALKAGRSFAEEAESFRQQTSEELGLKEDDTDIDDDDQGGAVAYDPGELPAEMGAGYPVDPILGGGANVGAPIGGRLIGRLAPPPKPVKGKPVSAPQIIDALSEVVKAAGRDMPIRYGRMGRLNARGVFWVGPEVIRVKTANNVATAAHEVGHALEKAVFGWKKGGPWKKPTASRKMQQELVKLGKALYGNRKPNGGYKREGFAEYMRLATTAPAKAKEQAPLFHAWFEGTFLEDVCPKCRKPIEVVRELSTRWRDQGSLARADASMLPQPGFRERLAGSVAAVRRFFTIEAWVEIAKPLAEYAAQAETRMGQTLAPEEDPFVTFSALRTTHDARAAQMVEDSMLDLAGNRVGPSLVEIRNLVRGRYREFAMYLWAKRALALWLDPNKGPRNPGISVPDAKQVVAELDSTNFQLAADKVYEWNEGVLNYAAQASPSMAAVVQRVREVDPGYYIPLQREFAELDSLWASKGGGGLGTESGGIVKALRGSGRRIKNPFPVMIANARSTVLKAHRRLILDQVIRLSKVEGMGNLVNEVPRDMVPVANRNIEDLIEDLNKRIFEKTGQALGVAPGEAMFGPRGPAILPRPGSEAEAVDTLDLAGETITFFSPSFNPKQGEVPVIPVWDSAGKRIRWYEVDERLLKTLAGMDVYRLPKVFDLFLGLPAELFRAGTTGLRASFMLVTNPMRDANTFYMQTKSSAWAPRLFFEWFRQLFSAGINRATGGRYTNPWLDAFQRLGGEMAQPLGQDIRHTERVARRLFQGRLVRTFDPRNAFDFVRDLLQFPESAARVAELKLVAKEVGWEPGQPMSLGQSLELLLSARQVTTDFAAAGEFSRVMNRIAPFHNASIQGPRAAIRAAKRNPGTFYLRGLQMTIGSLALWWWHKDEEWYKQLSGQAKAMYWHVPFQWQGKDELVRVPRPFELGMLFGGMPEMMADAWYQQEPETARTWFGQFFSVLMPNIEPVLLDEAFDQYANRDRFWDVPIVPMGEQRKPPEEQYSEYTSKVGVFLGGLFDVSPRRIDHAIKGTFGGVAMDVIDVVGLGGKKGRGGEPSDIPVFGRMFQRGGQLGYRPKAISRLYDTLREYELRQASDRVEETHEQRQVRLMLSDATRAVSALTAVRGQTEDTEKRRAIVRESVNIAQDALKHAEKGLAPRARFQAARRGAEARKKAARE